MRSLRAFESTLIRIEGAVAVAIVLAMLVLAGYNVVFRNVLVPLQKHWAHSGPPIVAPVLAPKPSATSPAAQGEHVAAKPTAEPSAAEGFGGDWGEGGDEDEDEDDAAPAKAAPAKAEPAKVEPAKAEPAAAEGFGGDWGEGDDGEVEDEPPAKAGPRVAAAAKPDDDELDDDELADEEDPFANLAMIEGANDKAPVDDGRPKGGPPPEGSFAAWAVAFIDTLKLDWIDVVLRQLVILIAFFGGMLATHRGKHINVDALSKLLGPGARRVLGVLTNALAVGVCIVLARAGSQLVAIGREHPERLVPWLDEWVFQLMYPFGFGLLAFHFGVRMLEAAAGLPPPGEPPPAPLPSVPAREEDEQP